MKKIQITPTDFYDMLESHYQKYVRWNLNELDYDLYNPLFDLLKSQIRDKIFFEDLNEEV